MKKSRARTKVVALGQRQQRYQEISTRFIGGRESNPRQATSRMLTKSSVRI